MSFVRLLFSSFLQIRHLKNESLPFKSDKLTSIKHLRFSCFFANSLFCRKRHLNPWTRDYKKYWKSCVQPRICQFLFRQKKMGKRMFWIKCQEKNLIFIVRLPFDCSFYENFGSFYWSFSAYKTLLSRSNALIYS